MSTTINRCVCRDILFIDIKTLMAQSNASVEDLQKMGVCADKCQMCKPYLDEMVLTGQTIFSDWLKL